MLFTSDLNPVEGVFSQVKSMMKENRELFKVTLSPRAFLAMLFATVTTGDCKGHIEHSGYT